MGIAVYLESQSGIDRVLPWVVRIALARSRVLDLYICAVLESERGTLRVPFGSEKFTELQRSVESFLNDFLGEEWWTSEVHEDPALAETGESDARLHVSLTIVSQSDPVTGMLSLVDDTATIVITLPKTPSDEGEGADRRRQLMRDALGEVIVLRPGAVDAAPCPILAPTSRSPHSSAALRLARELASATDSPLTALHVEPDIGSDSAGVGGRELDRLLGPATDDGVAVERRIEIDARPERAIARILQDEPFGLVILGASRLGGAGKRLRNSVGLGVVRATQRPTVVGVRGPIALRGRSRRWIEVMLHRRVPQLEREDRIALMERVQSNSHWDFDFVSLMSLSALIAAMGLIVSSSAVIIGAMLVAPLMTPLLGVGLALVQGNPTLARISLRSVSLGFAVVFVLSAGLGLVSTSFVELTPEMRARGWPLLLDLFVAFVSGLAAAYASSRPNLIAALPGVAIAAALVPPIATAGLAFSLGDFEHAAGATLLFLTNMVAIVLATAAALWTVGMRGAQKGSRITRITGGGFAAAALALGIALAISPTHDRERAVVPPALSDALSGAIPDDYRLRDVYFQRGALVIQVAGEQPPRKELARELSRIAHERIGDKLPVRVQGIWEVEAPAAGL